MRIGIIGGGAIGLLFASHLSEKHRVTLYTHTEDQASIINRDGIRLIEDGESRLLTGIISKGLVEGISGEDLLIVAVKQYHLPQILPWINGIQVPLLFLQNGFGHISYLKRLQSQAIYLGVVEHGAMKHDGNTVEHTGLGITRIASFKGELEQLSLVNGRIDHFPFKKSEDYHSMLMDKLVVNAVINPLTAILEVENGGLITNAFYYQLFQDLFEEISDILEVRNKTESFEHVKSVCMATAENRSSMLKDLENGRRTEIDAILGHVLSEAKSKGKSDCLTSSLYRMVKGKESQGG
ncbi:2-dehydropantoate 2-reductase [Peribacillus sp. NJ4]|uniref:2-dehydropantoate 2-reductase n=1 Tax=Peribacillus sp. NJ4 TaxID=3055862 RepID=UPI0025A0EDC2|nr:2-dehydropantoate 2-reductase [Peribacillus sp. NJ4]MDM5213487.1 2-dehydropantoate 2-reductase [Peribacillus sp. NJ4]